jgi:hypothetical protein
MLSFSLFSIGSMSSYSTELDGRLVLSYLQEVNTKNVSTCRGVRVVGRQPSETTRRLHHVKACDFHLVGLWPIL